MSLLDDKLFAWTSGYTESEWLEILTHVVEKMEVFLGQPVAVHGMKYYPNGFAGDIDSAQAFAGALSLFWFGRIGVTVVGANEATFLEATLFFRGAGKRLVAIDGNRLPLATLRETVWWRVWLDNELED